MTDVTPCPDCNQPRNQPPHELCEELGFHPIVVGQVSDAARLPDEHLIRVRLSLATKNGERSASVIITEEERAGLHAAKDHAVAYIRETEVAPRQETIDLLHQDLERVADKMAGLQEQLEILQPLFNTQTNALTLLVKEGDAVREQRDALVKVASRAVYFIPMGQPEYRELETAITSAREGTDEHPYTTDIGGIDG